MPSLADAWNQSPHASPEVLKRMYLIANNYEKSVLWYYCLNRKDNDIVPNISLIKDSVSKFTNDNIHSLSDIINIVKDPTCICVHIRNGDLDTEENYIKYIENISRMFNKVILLSGIHIDERFKNRNAKINNFVKTINSILKLNDNIYIYIENADKHLVIMSLASNLMLHKGGFSCLGSIVSTGKLFLTEFFTYRGKNKWKEMVNKPYTMLN
jgi:hypothetical protein